MCPEQTVVPTVGADIGLEVTGHEQHDAWWAKGWPPVEQVRPDVWSVPVPVPDNPIRYTLCYLIFGDGELVVVDPGWDTEPGWTALTDGLAAAGTSAAAVNGIVITHVHPDHHGLSARLAAASGAWVGMHRLERDSLPRHAYPVETIEVADARWLIEQGVPDDVAGGLQISDEGLALFASMAEPGVMLADAELIPLAGRRIQALWTPGHTPGHLCLLDEDNNLLLIGDHVLPRISPNVGLHTHSRTPPLGQYLNSLQRLVDYDSAEVLPAHEWRFRGLKLRVQQLLHHHEQRCQEIVEVMQGLGSCSSWQVTEKLTWSRGWAAVQGFQRRAALAETMAHLVHLAEHGRITKSEPDGGQAAATIYSLTS